MMISNNTMRRFTISVPASTANIGPGFDVLGIALSLELTVTALVRPSADAESSGIIQITYEGDSPETVPLNPHDNLILRTAMEVAGSVGKSLPSSLSVHIVNPIPLGRGLGSSGSAVVAGIALASAVLDLGFSKQRILDYALAMEGHPDNITASVLGGFVASYKRSIQDANGSVAAAASIPSPPSVTAPNSLAFSIPYPAPPERAACHIQLRMSPRIRFVVAVPEVELKTKLARSVLPPSYSREDVVFNLQRLAVLTAYLAGSAKPVDDSADPLDPAAISEAMQDKVHQNYRQHLVPGLPEILALNARCGKPDGIPGLLGLCISGAGPTVLALATDHFDDIGQAITGIYSKQVLPNGTSMKARYQILDLNLQGLRVTEH
ncbi:ribosomal protein S5 domain 2-type protein [Zopfochytrium polystomum]|nr:ribosomal protein S5 domain 2-type protein [Zopfochytrium polystomum]